MIDNKKNTLNCIDHQSILDFLQFGVFAPGKYFFVEQDLIPIPLQPYFSEDSPVTPRQALDILEKTISELVQSNQISSFAMSGGIDSRLIFSILYSNHLNFLKSIRVYNRSHPLLKADGDRDTLIAKSLCDQFNISLAIECSEKHGQFYLEPAPDDKGKILSGLWGSEVLGGALLSSRTFKIEDVTSCNRPSPLKEYLKKLEQPISKMNNTAWIYFDLLRKTKRSAFYQNLGWFEPTYADRYTVTPFLDLSFCSTVFRINDNELTQHQFYNRVVPLIEDGFLQLPINNINISPRYTYQIEKWGRDAKELPSEINLTKKWSSKHEIIKTFCLENPQYPFTKTLLNFLPNVEI